MSTTESTYTECEKHELFNCSLCNHLNQRRRTRNGREHSATGVTKSEVLHDVAKTVGLDPPVLTTTGETVIFWRELLSALRLGFASTPEESAQLVVSLAGLNWTPNCSTSPYHVSLAGLLRTRDAVVRLHRERQQ